MKIDIVPMDANDERFGPIDGVKHLYITRWEGISFHIKMLMEINAEIIITPNKNYLIHISEE